MKSTFDNGREKRHYLDNPESIDTLNDLELRCAFSTGGCLDLTTFPFSLHGTARLDFIGYIRSLAWKSSNPVLWFDLRRPSVLDFSRTFHGITRSSLRIVMFILAL